MDHHFYLLLLALLGFSIVVAHWIPHTLFSVAFSASPLIMIAGLAAHFLIPDWPISANPLDMPHIWERVAEMVVIIVLFATGLRIDQTGGLDRWKPTIRLLAIAMPVTIAAVALLSWTLAGLTIAGALMLGAVLAPTDPVLAGDVQVGPPGEGQEGPVRFALTTEAGLNDGLAFPFVYFALLVASQGSDPSGWLNNWLLDWVIWDVIVRISVGVICGIAAGWLLGRLTFLMIESRSFAHTAPGVIALGGTLLCYGATELLHGYGFLSVFVAGLQYRRANAEHHIHGRLHTFSESIEHAFSAVLLFFIGASLPLLWPAVDWRHTVIGFAIIIFIRPAVSMLSLIKTDLNQRDRWAISFLGVRGIGSIYYMAFAAGKIELINKQELWALVCYTIFASAVIHGATAKWIVNTPEPKGKAGRAEA